MFGFIVTTHFNNYDTIIICLNLLFDTIPENSYTVLYVNETTCPKVLKIKQIINEKYKNVKFQVFYIQDQKINNGLTGTWNLGINYLLHLEDFKCEVITILGHDTFVNKNLNILLQKAKISQDNKELKYFGPLYKNFVGKNDEYWQDEIHYKEYIESNNVFLIGSLLVIPIISLNSNLLSIKDIKKYEKNKKLICDYYYFDEINFPFGYNDIDWFNRFIQIGGKSEIVTECIIDHKYERSWIDYDPNIKKCY